MDEQTVTAANIPQCSESAAVTAGLWGLGVTTYGQVYDPKRRRALRPVCDVARTRGAGLADSRLREYRRRVAQRRADL
jgi:hypothetical protein